MMKSLPINFGKHTQIFHMRDIFAENYRLLHITLNAPENYGLIIENNKTMLEYEQSIGMKKLIRR